MKRLSMMRKMWLLRRARRTAVRKTRKGRTSSPRQLAVGYRQGKQRSMWVSSDPRPMPSVLCFETNYDETARFFDGLGKTLCANAVKARYRVKNRYRAPGWYDFSLLEHISPSAALVLAAEFERYFQLAKVGEAHTINMDHWKPEPRQTLVDLGFLSVLGIEAPQEVQTGDKHIVRFRSDSQVQMQKASSTLRELIGLAATAAVMSVGTDVLQNYRTFLQAIGEAVHNTSDHAYPAKLRTDLPHVGRWWITGAVDLVEKRLTFAVYDQGVSIPRAIPYGRRPEILRRFFRKWTGRDHDPENIDLDGRAIAAAVRGGVSGTGLQHRGRGLGLMRDCIRNERTGRLRIISRHGDFVACTGRKDEQHTLMVPLRGTLIEWTVNL